MGIVDRYNTKIMKIECRPSRLENGRHMSLISIHTPFVGTNIAFCCKRSCVVKISNSVSTKRRKSKMIYSFQTRGPKIKVFLD